MGRGNKTRMILDAMPLGEWLTANELGKRTGIKTRVIGSLISFRLINKFIERRPVRYDGGRFYEYRRLMRIDADMLKQARVT